MQFPITIGLRRSRFQAPLLAFAGLCGSGLAFLVPWSAFAQGALVGLVLVMVGWSSRRFKNRVLGLSLTREGILGVQFAGADESHVPVVMLPGATVHPWLTVFRIAHDARVSTLLITPDCIAADDFRRLRVWLKWQAIFGASTDGD